MKALLDYKEENIRVSRGLVILNLSQAVTITLGMIFALVVANLMVYDKSVEITPGVFVG
jgi:ABC-type transport system involved in Fe-S cluster assembly fused permease/ATPase subunit